MDFVTHLPWTSQEIVDWLTKSAQFLAVRMTFKLEEFYRLYIREIVRLHGVLVDWLTKSAHFLAVWMTFTLEEFYRLYIREIVRLHGVLVSIVSDRDPRFTAHFWESF